MKLLDKLLLSFLTITASLDILTTLYALHFYSGLVYETNPLGVYLPFSIKILAILTYGIFLHKLGDNQKLNRWLVRIAVIILALSWVGCAINNFFVILNFR